MKKLVCWLLCMSVIMGCGTATNPPITIENDHFSIAPQEFIDGWNAMIKDFKQSSKNEDVSHLIEIPDYLKSGQEIELGEYLAFTFEEDNNGRLQKIHISYNKSAGKAEAITFGFICASLPGYLNLGTSFDFRTEYDKANGQNVGGSIVRDMYDGKIGYLHTERNFALEHLTVYVANR